MSNRYVIEALLRPAVEFNTAVVAATAACICVTAPWAVALAPTVTVGVPNRAADRQRMDLALLKLPRTPASLMARTL